MRLVASADVRQLGDLTIEFVALRKPASTISDEKRDRKLSADASRQTGP